MELLIEVKDGEIITLKGCDTKRCIDCLCSKHHFVKEYGKCDPYLAFEEIKDNLKDNSFYFD